MLSKRRKEDVLNEFRRSELIASARRVFGAHGFAHATMESIARDADVAKGTVYLYYDSKRAIYEAAWRANMEELEALVKRRVESAATLQAAIAAFVEARLEFFQERQGFFPVYVEGVGEGIGRPKGRRPWCGPGKDRPR